MKSVFLILTFCLGFFSLSSQNGSLEFIEAIYLEVNKHNQVYYKHTLKPKETAYSLARYFNLPIEDLYLVNNITSEDILSIGTRLIIPIDKSLLRTPINKLNEDWVPVIYTVARQETLFKIAHSYFPQPIQNLISRNKVTSFSLEAGRNLVVGWWGPEVEDNLTAEGETKVVQTQPARQSIERDNETIEESSTKGESESIADLIRNKIIRRAENPSSEEITDEEIQRNEGHEQATQDTIISDIVVLDTIEQESTIEPEINYKSGIATWDKQGIDRENLFVMHNEAKSNSYIRLRHPVTKKEITALVLCPIPKGIHSSEVDIVLSPAVALALGALNTRFKIEMDYYQ